jgi:hypothetical protein
MSPESKNLLNHFASRLTSEVIYGEQERVYMTKCRENVASTAAARQALEAHITSLEDRIGQLQKALSHELVKERRAQGFGMDE